MVVDVLVDGYSKPPEYENVKWAIAEGTSLTLLGMIKYDAENDKFIMTELSSLIGGGMQETLGKLKERLDSLNESFRGTLIAGSILLGLGLIFTFGRYVERRRQAEMNR